MNHALAHAAQAAEQAGADPEQVFLARELVRLGGGLPDEDATAAFLLVLATFTAMAGGQDGVDEVSLAGTLAALGAGGAHVSIDPHELVTEATLPRWRELRAQTDAFFPSEDELRLDDAQTDPRRALKRLAGGLGRLRFVAYKRGLKGGLLYDAREDRFHEWAARTHGVVDPTGAGDAFATGFLVAHLRGLPIEDCLRHGVVSASFAIEDWGPDGLLAATPPDAAARLREWYGQEAHA